MTIKEKRSAMMETTQIGCKCGHVGLEVERQPIVSCECCCNSCQTAGERLQALPDAPSILDKHGATRFVLYRKDRVRFLKGEDLLKEFRLSSTATTRRVVATCCNTPVFLEFKGGHWLSLYADLWPAGTLPSLQLRTMTDDLPEGTVLPGDVPHGRAQTLLFFAKLFAAWIAMGSEARRCP